MDFLLYAGDTKALEVTVRDAAGDVVDVTGATIRWQLAEAPGEPALVSKTTVGAGGVSIVNGAQGRFDVAIAAGDTDDLDGVYYHEAEVELLDGTVATVLAGFATIARTLIA